MTSGARRFQPSASWIQSAPDFSRSTSVSLALSPKALTLLSTGDQVPPAYCDNEPSTSRSKNDVPAWVWSEAKIAVSVCVPAAVTARTWNGAWPSVTEVTLLAQLLQPALECCHRPPPCSRSSTPPPCGRTNDLTPKS